MIMYFKERVWWWKGQRSVGAGFAQVIIRLEADENQPVRQHRNFFQKPTTTDYRPLKIDKIAASRSLKKSRKKTKTKSVH